MKIYIAGKVTGEPIHEVTMKFGSVQKQLEDLGHEVINPLEVVGTFNTTWHDAMRKCIAAMMGADLVYFMPCTKNSKGALLEMELATKLKIPVTTDIDTLYTVRIETTKL